MNKHHSHTRTCPNVLARLSCWELQSRPYPMDVLLLKTSDNLEHYVVDGNIDFEILLKVRSSLPSLVLRRYGLLPEGLDGYHKKVFQECQKWLGIEGKWLQYYLLNRMDLREELHFTDYLHYKPMADKEKALLDILQEIYFRVAWLQESISSPGIWWVQMIAEALLLEFHQNGLLGYGPIESKRESYERMNNQSKEMEDMNKYLGVMPLENIKLLDEEGLYKIGNTPVVLPKKYVERNGGNANAGLVFQIAAKEAQECKHFTYGPWKDFLGIQKRCDRILDRDSRMKPLRILDNGELWNGGRGSGKRGKNKSRKKGFQSPV